MKAVIVNAVAGVMLFSGSLIGGLAVTGRLNHEGTANIPVLNQLFPAPPAPSGAEAGGGAVPAVTGAAGTEAADAVHGDEPRAAVDAAHEDPQPSDGAIGAVRMKTGRSLFEGSAPVGEDGSAQGDAHGADEAHGGAENTPTAGAPTEPANAAPPAVPAGEAAVRTDLLRLEQDLAHDRHTKYAPGGFFRFDGMPAGLSPEQINEAWQRVQGVMTEIERRKVALDLREQELQELADDISRRQAELGAERTRVDQRHRELDARIQKFQEQVKLVRNDEVAALKRNAQTLAAFEASKAAEIVMDQWKTEQGQNEILQVLEFMERDKVDEILAELPNATVQDVLRKRMRVTREPAASDVRR